MVMKEEGVQGILNATLRMISESNVHLVHYMIHIMMGKV